VRTSLVSRFRAFVIAGPTGVGKSDVAVEVALAVGGEIVGADAYQIYAGLDILTAKPGAALRKRVPHWLVGEVPLTQSFDVAQYLAMAEMRMNEIRSRGKIPIVAGGTGLYVRALIRGLDELPPGDPALRLELEKQPLSELQQRLTELDPVAAGRIDLMNPRRVVRALEVCLVSGKPFSSFGQEWNAPTPANCGIVLLRERAELYARVDRRVEEMFRDGVVEEVERARANLSPTAQQTLGWREIRQFIAGETTQEACIAAIQQATRQYAKRQLTWYRKEVGLTSMDVADVGMRELVDTIVAQQANSLAPAPAEKC